jgi:myosin heavy subunit
VYSLWYPPTRYARDALGKAVYYRAFDWVVGRLNKALDEGGKSDGR